MSQGDAISKDTAHILTHDPFQGVSVSRLLIKLWGGTRGLFCGGTCGTVWVSGQRGFISPFTVS